jgi:uncharacterized membrane protein YkvA (DUF1232 family)
MMMTKALDWVSNIKEPYALFLMIKDPQTTRKIKILAWVIIGLIAVYTISPIDMLPDAIPLAGWLDDLLLIPIGLKLIERMLPPEILIEKRAIAKKRVNRVLLTAALVGLTIVLLWAAGIAAFILVIIKLFNG